MGHEQFYFVEFPRGYIVVVPDVYSANQLRTFASRVRFRDEDLEYQIAELIERVGAGKRATRYPEKARSIRWWDKIDAVALAFAMIATGLSGARYGLWPAAIIGSSLCTILLAKIGMARAVRKEESEELYAPVPITASSMSRVRPSVQASFASELSVSGVAPNPETAVRSA